MPNKDIINQIQSLLQGENISITAGMSTEDITKPIYLEDVLIEKRQRFVGFAPPAELPFEIQHRVEGFDFYSYREDYIFIGLVLFDLMFSDLDYIEFHIPRLPSQISTFFVYLDRDTHHDISYSLKYAQHEKFESYEYWPMPLERYALAQVYDQNAQPSFSWSSSDYASQYSGDYLLKADQLVLACTVESLVEIATLFLNIGNNQNERDEISLENPTLGVGGVNAMSIEARFWLPGSFGFPGDSLDDIAF